MSNTRKHFLKKKISSPFSAIALLEYLMEKPHLSIQEIASHFEISYQVAQSMVIQFENLEILKEITGKKRDRRYSYWKYIECLSEGTSNIL